jgi:murein DD-endopeptidase MepM/ murein hydrolase activator NlpD
MSWGTRRNVREHKIKSQRYITFVIITNPTKSPKTIKIPKWIRFPILTCVIAAIIWVLVTMTNVADAQNKMANANLNLQTNTYENSDKELKIKEYEAKEAEKFSKLNDLQEIYTEVMDKLQQLENKKQDIDSKLNGTKKTTESKPVGVIERKASAEPLVAEFSASRSTNLDGTRMEPTTMGNIEDEADIERQMMSVEEGFQAEAEDLLIKFQGLIELIDNETNTYDNLNNKVDKIIPYWEAYPSMLPVKDTWITSPYGWRKNPFGRKAFEFHRGVDLKAYYGTSVYATGKGTVIFSGYDSIYGKLVIIDHGYGITTKYAHNSRLLVSKGDKVKRGDKIAKSGSTGRSSGPHVHYGVLINGETKNPMDYIYKGK